MVTNYGSGRGEDTPNKSLKGLFSIVTSDNKFQHVVRIFPYQERFTPRQRRQKRALMTHKYRGSIVVLSISKRVEPNEELKVEPIFPQVLSTTDTTLRTLDVRFT